ncbi:MAG: T9SS type A sorting domain-containing protein [Chitinophagaceae bacterium]
MTSDKTVTGNITLLNANSLIELLNFNLTVSGTIGISQTSSYVKTNGTGKLTLNNITAFPGKLFPIGLSTVNPLYITSTSPSNYSARVVEPITPPIYNDIQAVLRTWYISSSVNTPGASISFGYTFNLTECGPLYNNAGPVEVGVNISNIWNVHQSGLIPMAFPIVPGTFVVTPGAVISYFNNPVNEFPFVVANNGAILPLDYFITARAQKRNNNGDISWKILETAGILNFEVQRSVNNSAFSTLATFTPTDNQFDYNYIDAALQAGTNLYRIRVNRSIGSIRYSNTVAVLNGANGLLITGLAPNPVHDNALLTISAAKPATVQFQLYNMYGSMIRQWNAAVAEGTNTIPVNTAGIPTGIYQLTAMGSGGKAQFRLVKQ